MNIIFGDAVNNVPDSFTVLELDTFYIPEVNQHIKTYALIEKIPLDEFATMEAYKKIHEDLIKFYKQQHWTYCEHAIEKLMGRWNHELDSFYENLLDRIKEYKNSPPADDWDGSLIKSMQSA